MRHVRVALMVIGCLAALPPAQAQEKEQAQEQETYTQDDTGVMGPFVWNIGGLIGVPVGNTSDRANVGGGFVAGLTFNPSHPLGLQFEYGTNWFSLKTNQQLANLGIFGNGFMQYFNLNAVLRPFKGGGRVGFYLIGGGGLYYRRASVNQVEGTAVVPYCDPYLFFCSAAPVTASSVIGARTSWDWGVDGGIGFTYALSPPVRLYVEARFHYIFGPSFTAANGETRTADGEFVPVTIGVKF
jgi:hypothetical protein